MTDRFKEAMTYVFLHEGGYNDIKEDAGGATQWGISLAFLKTLGKQGDINHDGIVNWLDIKKLTKDEANELYWDNFWRPLYDKLPKRTGIKVYDLAVNAGHNRAHILLQKTLVKLGSKVSVDGVIGQQTLSECAKYTDAKLVDTYCIVQADFYKALVVSKPTYAKFINGWMKRAAWKPK